MSDIKKDALAIVVGVTALFIGLFVYDEIDGSINRSGWSAAQNTTYTGIQTTTLSAFTLGGVGLIVLGASGIMRQLKEWG